MNLNASEIRMHTSVNDYSRGVSYFKQHKVTKCLVKVQTHDELVIEGITLGTYADKYTQSITITKSNGLNISGSCSCPVGYNCKHVVAVCLEYTENGRMKMKLISPVNELENWFHTFQSEQKREKINEDEEYFITYRLFSTNKNRSKDALQFYKSRYLKNKSLSKGQLLQDHQFSRSYYNQDIKDEADEKIADLVRNLVFESYNTSMSFEGKFGAILLQEILETKRCYYNDNTQALCLEPQVIQPKFDFEFHKDTYTIKSDISKKYVVFKTQPSYILDIEANKVCEFDFDAELYEKLLKAPKIPKEDIAKVCRFMSEEIPHLQIQTPKGLQTKIIDAQAIAQIHLSANSFKVDFNYDGYVVKYAPRQEKSFLYEEDQKVEIRRDLAFEESAKKMIEGFGFDISMLDSDLWVQLNDAKRQQQLEVFREFENTHLPKLEEEGWYIKNLNSFEMKFEQNTEIIVESEEKNDWFSLSFNLEFDGMVQPLAPLVASIIQEFDNFEAMPDVVNIEVGENHFVTLQTKQISPIIKTLLELMDKKDKDDTLRISAYDAHMLSTFDAGVIWKGSREILELSQKLKNFKGIQKVTPPKNFQASLREYQQDGLNWLQFLHEFKFGGILADDMGLGKTIQTLAHVSKLKEDAKLDKPVLIVMPTSLIANWKNEVKKFTPNLSVLSLHGDDREERFPLVDQHDILLTTYALIVRDKEKFDTLQFSYIILDEAQKIKNPKTKMAIAIKEFRSDYRLALSGTPIENHLGELWSIFSFLMPGFLDTLSFFTKYYQTPIEKERSFSKQELLNKRIKPFMLRRTKELVASELPVKSEIIKYTQFEHRQSGLYESIRIAMEEKVRQAVANKGIASSHITILDALLKLRQVCCDPSLLKLNEAKKVKESAKLVLFLDLIEELLSENKKILVFSQFTSMLAIIEEKMKSKKISYTKLTGSTRNREKAIEEFTSGKVDVFLISLKAGGVGLNLVEADTVIHYDPWWNPAVENQATDRAYRIGQTKAVFVYKLIVENTIEQKILELQKKKQVIQDGIYDENKQQDDVKFSANELLELLK